MVGVYFSGTGNTGYCIEKFVHGLDTDADCISIEHPSAVQAMVQSDFIVLAYPVYFSNLPKIMRDFLENNRIVFSGKKVFILSTMGLFSGDGTGCAARLLKKYGALIVGGLHLKMPACIGDEKLLKKTKEENRILVKQAEEKIKKRHRHSKAARPRGRGFHFYPTWRDYLGRDCGFLTKQSIIPIN